MVPLSDKTALVTGSTDGLGKALATELAARGATVLVHGRDEVKGLRVLDEIRERTTNFRLYWYEADLSSLAAVRELAARVRADHARLDILVNNAGIGFGDGTREESADGYELRFAVNYLAAYLLTELLAPMLVESAPARVVHVASAGQEPIDFDDLMLEHRYDGVTAYRRSKLAMVMHAFDAAARLTGRGLSVVALHPGTFMPTKMVTEAGIEPVDSLEQGLESVLKLVTEDELASGAYFEGLREAPANGQAYDAEARALLRRATERLVAGKAGAAR